MKNAKKENPFAPKPSSKSGRQKGRVTRILVGMLVFLCVLLAVVLGKSASERQADNAAVSDLTDGEILHLEGHPRIYDDFSEAVDFYAQTAPEKVKLLSVADDAVIQRKLGDWTNDSTVLYLIQHPTYADYVGSVRMNLLSKEKTENLDAEKAMELLAEYLPKQFAEYYYQDACYQYTQKNQQVYVSSYRLNDAGIAYHDGGEKEASFYYTLEAVHRTDTDQWLLKTDYAAYGDKGLDWIQTYAQDWELDLRPYID